MDNNNINFEIVSINTGIANKQVTDKILLCNEDTKKYGLVLTQNQALALAKTRETALKDNKRIEFSSGIVDKMIMAFCDSPYITKENYEETLHELINLFYDIKNNTWDRVSDNYLLDFLKTSFNSNCKGSFDLLIEKSMKLVEHIHCGKSIDTFQLKEE